MKWRIRIYSLIDLIVVSLLFILVIPFFVDLGSLLFADNWVNLFAFKTIFPVLFTYVINANAWINGAIFSVCFFYIITLLYFNIHFYRVAFNKARWLVEYTAGLFIITLLLIIILLMMIWSWLHMAYYLSLVGTPASLAIFTLIPGIDVLSLFYWVPMIFVKGWDVVFLGLNLIWFSCSTGLLIRIAYKRFYRLLRTDKKWNFYL